MFDQVPKYASVLIFYDCMKSVLILSFSGLYFPAFGLNTERYGVSLPIQSECEKIRTRKTPNTDTIHAVYHTTNFRKQRPPSILRVLHLSKFYFEISLFRYKHLNFSPFNVELYLATAKTFDIINHFNTKLARTQKK